MASVPLQTQVLRCLAAITLCGIARLLTVSPCEAGDYLLLLSS